MIENSNQRQEKGKMIHVFFTFFLEFGLTAAMKVRELWSSFLQDTLSLKDSRSNFESVEIVVTRQ